VSRRPFGSGRHPHCPCGGALAPAPCLFPSRWGPDLWDLAPRDLGGALLAVERGAGDVDPTIGVASQLPDRQATLVKGRHRRQDRRLQRLVLAQGFDPTREDQGFQAERLAGHRPERCLQLCPGEIGAGPPCDPAAVIGLCVHTGHSGPLLQGGDVIPQEIAQRHHRRQAAPCQLLDPVPHWDQFRR
jgi:hypothetical protein